MKKLLMNTVERATRYMEEVESRRVAPAPEALARLAELKVSLPEHPTEPDHILALLDEIGSPATVTTTGGRYFGFVNGGALPAAVAANWLAAAWDQNAALAVMSPVAAALEEVALGWVIDLLGLPADCGGAVVTGATMANFTALAAARHAVLRRAGWDVEADGLFGAPPITVVVGAETHISLLKALALLGLGRSRVVTVPADGQGRMRAEAFPKLQGPSIVCVQAGNVNTGAFDPAVEICALAHEHGAWVHIDGAFGLWAAVSPSRAHLTRGFADADSWATDAHKWLNQVLVSFGDAETTRHVIAGLQTDGTCWCGGTVWQGQTAMRISVSSWATTEEDVERSLAAMLRIAGAVRAGRV
ncbi:MAG: aminotransferase class V-fold PLP-dependent enzyme [Acidobacteria bacterium]|nr:aminotransferase class V-fold PLP-dependent enzyme [Acidobacteriota bacterium]